MATIVREYVIRRLDGNNGGRGPMVINVRVSRRLRARLWIGTLLLRFAAWVMTVGIEIEEFDA